MIIISNMAAPIVLNLTGNMTVVASIVPLEALLLWLWLNRGLKLRYGFLKILLLSLLMNLISGAIGVPFLWNLAMRSLVSIAACYLPFFFVLTIIIEVACIFQSFKPAIAHSKISYHIIASVIIANIISYFLFFTVLVPIAFQSDRFSQVVSYPFHTTARKQQEVLIRLQQAYFAENQAFAQNLSELGSIPMDSWSEISSDLLPPNDHQISGQVLQHNLVATEMRVRGNRIDFISKLMRQPVDENFSFQTTGVLWITDNNQEVVGGMCQLEYEHRSDPTPDPSQIYVQDNEVICPPNSGFIPVQP